MAAEKVSQLSTNNNSDDSSSRMSSSGSGSGSGSSSSRSRIRSGRSPPLRIRPTHEQGSKKRQAEAAEGAVDREGNAIDAEWATQTIPGESRTLSRKATTATTATTAFQRLVCRCAMCACMCVQRRYVCW
jgi:hypothetical protein